MRDQSCFCIVLLKIAQQFVLDIIHTLTKNDFFYTQFGFKYKYTEIFQCMKACLAVGEVHFFERAISKFSLIYYVPFNNLQYNKHYQNSKKYLR